MNNFPVATQNDLVLTSSVNWSSDVKGIIENDEKEFEESTVLPRKSSMASQIEHVLPNKDHLNMSWGNYFAQKSPPMGDLAGSFNGMFQQRPQFQHEHNPQKQSELDSEKDSLAEHKQHEAHKIMHKNEMMAPILEDDMEENDEMMINVDESLENIHLGSLPDYVSNRDSNSTEKSNRVSTESRGSTNKLIHVPTLKYTQRFYQFTVSNNALNDEHIEGKIEQVINKYIESQPAIKAHVSATTFNPHTKICTVLILFDPQSTQNNDEWINTFLSFPQILKLMDQAESPCFTQLSAY